VKSPTLSKKNESVGHRPETTLLETFSLEAQTEYHTRIDSGWDLGREEFCR